MNTTFKLFILQLVIITLLDSVAHANSDNTRAQALFDRGTSKYDSGDLDLAVKDLKESYKLVEFSFTAYYLSCAYAEGMDYVVAEQYARKATRNKPPLPDVFRKDLSAIIDWAKKSKESVAVVTEYNAKADNVSQAPAPPPIPIRITKADFPQGKSNSKNKTFIIEGHAASSTTKVNKVLKGVLQKKLQSNQIFNEKKKGTYSVNRVAKIFNGGLRKRPHSNLTFDDVTAMCVKKGFYDGYKNKKGTGFANKFTKANYVIDHSSNLIWQLSGSAYAVNYKNAKAYIARLKTGNFAGFSDWRLPTIEEAMSLMEPRIIKKLRIDSLFDAKQQQIWTSDQSGRSNIWYVDFAGSTGTYDKNNGAAYIRAVRDYRPK